MRNKFNLGDKFWTFDYHFDDFIQEEVTHIKIVLNDDTNEKTVMYNGMYEEQYCFAKLKDAYLAECDYRDKKHREELRKLNEKLNAILEKE